MELGRSPKVREVAKSLGYTVEDVLEAQQAAASYDAASSTPRRRVMTMRPRRSSTCSAARTPATSSSRTAKQ